MMPCGDKQYPLCLLDTNAASEIVDERFDVFDNFYAWAQAREPQIVPCFTIYTLMELRRRPKVFERFVERFQIMPCALVKGYMQLIEEQAACYPNPSGLDPCAIAFTFLGDEGNQLKNLPGILALPDHAAREVEWNQDEQGIVDGMVSMRSNYPPDNGTSYTVEEIEHFVWQASFEQLVYHEQEWVSTRLAGDELVEMDAFPSLKAMLYTVFHKFYADPARKPERSDGFDVLNASALPFVEAVVTERHQAEVSRKVQQRDEFLNDLEVFRLVDFRDGVPGTTAKAAT